MKSQKRNVTDKLTDIHSPTNIYLVPFIKKGLNTQMDTSFTKRNNRNLASTRERKTLTSTKKELYLVQGKEFELTK